jgi:hypothetical protein
MTFFAAVHECAIGTKRAWRNWFTYLIVMLGTDRA